MIPPPSTRVKAVAVFTLAYFATMITVSFLLA